MPPRKSNFGYILLIFCILVAVWDVSYCFLFIPPPLVFQYSSSGFSILLQWFFNTPPVVFQYCSSGFSIILQWFFQWNSYSGLFNTTTVVFPILLQWFLQYSYSGLLVIVPWGARRRRIFFKFYHIRNTFFLMNFSISQVEISIFPPAAGFQTTGGANRVGLRPTENHCR